MEAERREEGKCCTLFYDSPSAATNMKVCKVDN